MGTYFDAIRFDSVKFENDFRRESAENCGSMKSSVPVVTIVTTDLRSLLLLKECSSKRALKDGLFVVINHSDAPNLPVN